MKTIITIILSILAILSFSQTAGTLTVTTTTSSAGGNYAPRNIVAIWIENSSGDFIKTLMAYANNRKTHLNIWEASTSAAGSIYNTNDAITGATRTSHDERTCFWDGTDFNGQPVTDGNYKVWMELTDKNGTGNFSSFEFTKGENMISITPPNQPSFSMIFIVWEPLSIGISEDIDSKYKIYPNPSNEVVFIEGEGIINIELYNSYGQLLKQANTNMIDVSRFKNGTYTVAITTSYGKFIKKLVIQ